MIRVLDVVFSGLALLLLLPLFLVVMVVLRLTGEGEVFYRQERAGQQGRSFDLLKFVTMVKDSPNIGTGVLTVKNDPRILPIGHFLRNTKINELPQLVNVLLGDMSLIGPRPLARPHFDALPKDVQAVLAHGKPGLSGIGSIVFRHEEDVLERAQDRANFHANVISPYKAKVETWYLQHRSLPLYLTLIFLTVWVVLVPSSTLYRKLLKGLPEPPPELQGL